MLHNLNFLTYQFNPLDGYGLYAIELVEQLIRLGYPVAPLQLPSVLFDWEHLPDPLKPYSRYDWSGLTVQLLPADAFRRYQGQQWGYSMWEDDSIPHDWPEAIHKTVSRVIVPCDFYAEVFAENGVKVPIHVVPGGTNTERFLPLPDRSSTRPFTFLVLGDRGLRKGLEVVLNALRTSYWANKRDVRLLIKTRPHAGSNNLEVVRWTEPRAVIWQADVPNITQVFHEADCYVYTSYGDMATAGA
jgi:glycosyltransferase involved in cell wall biosynthesis